MNYTEFSEHDFQQRQKAAAMAGISYYVLRRMIDKGEVALHLIDAKVCVDVNEIKLRLKKTDLFSAA